MPMRKVWISTMSDIQIYSGDPKTGGVRFLNGRPWSGFRMVQKQDGCQSISLDHSHDHSKTGHVSPVFEWLLA